jgi:cytochrome c2
MWLLAMAIGGPLLPAAHVTSGSEAKLTFRKRCMACHTFGRGVKVGPDLKGVTERRKREWLLRFISSSSSVIQSGDPTATKLFRDFKRERMPDWSDLSPEEIGGILDYLAASGPLQKEPDERDATTATAAEVRAGKMLFHGGKALTFGGRACDTCHSIGGVEGKDGHLGPDLTRVYLKYRDRGLTDYLKRPCFAREPERSDSDYLTPQESFDLKSYMASAAGISINATMPAGAGDKGMAK